MHNFGGGRSNLFNSGGGGQRGGGIFPKFRGSWLKGGVKKFRGGGVWTLDEAMALIQNETVVMIIQYTIAFWYSTLVFLEHLY